MVPFVAAYVTTQVSAASPAACVGCPLRQPHPASDQTIEAAAAARRPPARRCECPAVQSAGFPERVTLPMFRLDIEDRERNARLRSRVGQGRNVDRCVEANQGVRRAKSVQQRATVGQPGMRHPRPWHRRGGKAAHAVGRRCLAIIRNDRRSIIVVAKVQAGAAILLNVEIVGCASKLFRAPRRRPHHPPRFPPEQLRL